MPVTEYRFGPRLWKTTLPDNTISKLYKKANALRDTGGLNKEELSKGNKEWVANPTLRFDAFEFTWMEGLLKPFIDNEFGSGLIRVCEDGVYYHGVCKEEVQKWNNNNQCSRQIYEYKIRSNNRILFII